jgi:hypothetical protein
MDAGLSDPATSPSSVGRAGRREHRRDVREARRVAAEHVLVRLVATCGIVAIGVAIAAIMVSSNSAGWLVGLVVSIVSVVLTAVLWMSRAF